MKGENPGNPEHDFQNLTKTSKKKKERTSDTTSHYIVNGTVTIPELKNI